MHGTEVGPEEDVHEQVDGESGISVALHRGGGVTIEGKALVGRASLDQSALPVGCHVDLEPAVAEGIVAKNYPRSQPPL